MPASKLTQVARKLRKHDTWAEKVMWAWLRDRRFSQFKFRRQHCYGPYVLDFFCVEALLNIELDGSQHAGPEQGLSDRARDEYLRTRLIQVL